jgi:hypothetical protein
VTKGFSVVAYKKVKVKVYRNTLESQEGGVVKVQLYSFLTSALEGGGWSSPRPGRFTPGKDPVPIVQEAGWAPGPVWTWRKISLPQGFDPRTVQPVASFYTD